MLMQTIILTALPHKLEKLPNKKMRLHLNVFVTPRLRESDANINSRKLSDYPDWTDWTKTVAKLNFQVRFGGSANPLAAKADFSRLNSNMWQALFPAEQRVAPYKFELLKDLHQRSDELSQLSVGAMHEELRDAYSNLLGRTYPNGKLPTRGELNRKLAELGLESLALPATPIPVVKKGGRPVLQKLDKRLVNPAASETASANLGVQAVRNAQKVLTSNLQHLEPHAAAPDYDFHERVSLLNDYSRLLPMLGLVIKLSVEVADNLPLESVVSVEVSQSLQTPTTLIFPRTHYVINKTQNRFAAKPAGKSPIAENGCLKLAEADKFEIIQTDAVGGMFKLRNAATNLKAEENSQNKALNAPNIPSEQGLPALQNAGLQIVQKNALAQLRAQDTRAALFQAQVEKKEQNPNHKPVIELFADDLTLGYRLDVLDVTANSWMSLHQCLETFVFADKNVKISQDGSIPNEAGETTPKNPKFFTEGFVQAAISASHNNESEELNLKPFLSDILCVWDGWSLSAPRPGAKLAQPPDFKPATGNAAADLRFSADYKVKPKSLPKLRFGHKYRLRARAVDLAGQSAFSPFDEPATSKFQTEMSAVSKEIVYQRFAPVLPPAMIYKSRQSAPAAPQIPIEGESLERMVVRSDFANQKDAQTISRSERFFAAPKAAQTTVELHEKLDGLSPQAAYEFSVREYATLIYTHQPVINPIVPHVEFEEAPGVKRFYRLFEGARKIERREEKKRRTSFARNLLGAGARKF